MIEIKVNCKGKKTEVSGRVNVEGRTNAINEFYAVLCALLDCDEDVLLDALGRVATERLEELENEQSES